jgi:hypothetical protein
VNRSTIALSLAGLILLNTQISRADVVSDWNSIMVSVVRTAPNAFFQGRLAAITELAVYEAVNACTPTYQPYLGTINAAPGASPEAAAVAAAHDVLVHYFPLSTITLDADEANSLSHIFPGPSRDNGIAVGQAAAAAMIARRANDGSAPTETFLPSSSDAGVWQPTPPAYAAGILLNWRNVTPFAIKSSDQFRVKAPPALTSAKYTRSYLEVAQVGER